VTIHTTKGIKIFYSYAQEDETLRKQLDRHLAPLRQQGLTSWHDHKILPGAERAVEIDQHLNTAHIVLLLISPHFMESSNCYNVEIERALQRSRAGETRVIPIILRPVNLQGTVFASLEALPKNKKPVTKWIDKDEACVDIANGIQSVIDDIAKQGTLGDDNPDKQAMRTAFAAQTQQFETSLPALSIFTKRNFRRELVTEFDLRTVIEDFKRPLIHGRAFSFTIAGKEPLLRDYVIERLVQEFKQEMQGECFQDLINLNQYDLSLYPLESLFEEKIKTKLKSNNRYTKYAHELVTKQVQEHVILTVWNYDLPLQTLQQAATAFWTSFVPTIARHLSRKNLCFILILAHLPPETQPCLIEDFVSLRLPQFDVQKDLFPWLTRQLHTLNVPAQAKEYCLGQLSDLYPDPVQMLRCLQHIASYLQGEYNEGRFQEVKGRYKRRSL
jgi:TIR domain